MNYNYKVIKAHVGDDIEGTINNTLAQGWEYLELAPHGGYSIIYINFRRQR